MTIELSDESEGVSQKYLDELCVLLPRLVPRRAALAKGETITRRFASIPRNFKGAILVKELEERVGGRDGGEGGAESREGDRQTHTHTPSCGGS